MNTILKVRIPQFYSAYADVLADGHEVQLYTMTVQYHCKNCGADFIAKHRPQSRPFSYYYYKMDDEVVTCPVCGHAHWNFGEYSEIAASSADGASPLPIDMELQLDEVKSGFILRARETLLRMHKAEPIGYATQVHRTEEFHFDVAHRKTIYKLLEGSHRLVLEEKELGDPFDTAQWLYGKSALWHLRTDNMAFRCREKDGRKVKKNYLRHRVGDVLRELRTGLRRKWKAYHGYDIGSLFVPAGRMQGDLLFQLVNFAWRLLYPDAKNLDKVFGMTSYEQAPYRERRMLTADALKPYLDFKTRRRDRNSVQGIAEAFGLPDTAGIRKLLQEDIFRAAELRAAYQVAQGNIDHTYQILGGVDWLARHSVWDGIGPKAVSKLYGILQEMTGVWPVKDVVRFANNKNGLHYVRDVYAMVSELSPQNRIEMRSIKLKNLHDWAAAKISEQEHKGTALGVPEAVTRRLQMQLDSGAVNFFVPQHSIDLQITSKVMRNCVRTYSKRVLRHECYITLMTDDQGRLKACLEVRNGALVQAKLHFNRPVKEDGAVNAAVVDWCSKAGLKIDTCDIRETRYPVPIDIERMTA